MKILVCAIFDVISDKWLPPFCQQTKGQAIRSFMDEVNRPAEDSILYKHPDDFVLYAVAKFDDETGEFEDVETGDRKLISGREAKNVVKDSLDQPRLKGVN